MAPGPKLVADHAEHGTEARSVPQALEPLQTSLTLTNGLVRVFDAVVLPPAAEMGNGWQHAGFRCRVVRTAEDAAMTRQMAKRFMLTPSIRCYGRLFNANA